MRDGSRPVLFVGQDSNPANSRRKARDPSSRFALRRLPAGVLVLMLGAFPAQTAAPPAQPRNLTAPEQKEVDALQTRLDRHTAAGEFAESARLAERIARFRAQRQGARHWQAIDARFASESWQLRAKVPVGDRRAVLRANELSSEGVALLNKGSYREAEKSLRETLAIYRKVLGELHPDTAGSCNNLAYCLLFQARHAEAMDMYQRALTVYLKVHGEQHPSTARSYNNQAACLAEQGKYGEALRLYRRALDIKLQVQGARHPDTGTCYNNLASCISKQGKDREALPLYRRGLAISLEVHGEQHAYTATSYNNVAGCLNRLGRYGEALLLFRRALAINLEVRGEQHPITALNYYNLAYCLNSQGKYDEARALNQRALAIRLKVHGEQHPDTAQSYNGVAGGLSRQGKQSEALTLHRRALGIYLKFYGELHPDTATSYSRIAFCLDLQGKHAEALPLYKRALAIDLKLHGEKHSETARGYNSVAWCLDSMGKHDEAWPLYQRAFAIFREVHGEEHPHTATSYNNLAACLSRQGKHEEALPLYRRALAVFLKVQGEEYSSTARAYNNMAFCLSRQGKHDQALTLLRRAMVISFKVQGEQHPDAASICNNLAICLNEQGRRAETLRLIQASLPDQEAARFLTASTGFDRALASAGQSSPHAMLAAGLARLNQPVNALRQAEFALARGLLDDLADSDPVERQHITRLTGELHSLGESLVRLLGLSTLSEEEVALRDRLLLRRRIAEADLARLASAVSARQVLSIERIQRQIPEDAALILWIDELGEHLGCVLRCHGPPAWVPLRGSGKTASWTEDDISLPERCYVTLTDTKASATLREALYQQRLAPLEMHLKGVRHLLVIPTGALAKVPVESLTDRWRVSYVPSGSAFARAAERTRTSRLASALVLADPVFTPTPPKYPPAPPSGVLVKAVVNGGLAARVGLRPGDVLLEYAGKTLKAAGDLKTTDGDDRVAVKLWRDGTLLSGRIPAGTLDVAVDKRPIGEALASWRDEERKQLAYSRGTEWTPLPGTRLEARALARLLPSATLLLGSAASEQTLEKMALSGKLKNISLLHLATHGEASSDRPLDTALILAQDHLPQPKEQEARVLAGKKPVEGRLSVDTILRTWRLDAELVTLSACQTGLGANASGEGMLGFAQALLQKGAHSVLLSRWKVDDNATALLMVRFYENLLGKREGLKAPLPKAEALREAKQWLRGLSRAEAKSRLTTLVDGVPRGERGSVGKALPARKPEAGKEDPPFAHPYYWAAFVLIGDPR